MERLNGWQRLWAVVSVIVGLSVMIYLSDAYMRPTETLKAVYDSDIARLEDTLKQVSRGAGSEQAVKQAEEAIAASKSSYVKLVQDVPKVAIWTFIIVALTSVLASVGVFLAGMGLRWVYRGSRPLPTAPMEADQPPPLGVHEASHEPRLALGHQETQQNPSASPTPVQEPVKRE